MTDFCPFLECATKLTNDPSRCQRAWWQSALAHGIVLFVAVAVASNISKGHLNPTGLTMYQQFIKYINCKF